MEASLNDLIEKLNLVPHPSENGFMNDVSCHVNSDHTITVSGLVYACSNTAQFLYTHNSAAPCHRMHLSDLVWIHQGGTDLQVHIISPDGEYRLECLRAHQVLRIRADHWFSCCPLSTQPDQYCLFAVVSSPAFHPENCQFADASVINDCDAPDNVKQELLSLIRVNHF